MSDHILDLLGAYIDGELHGGQLRKVEVQCIHRIDFSDT